MLRLERLEYGLNEFLSLQRLQVKLVFRGFPGAICAPEDYAIPFIQEHLGCAARVLTRMIRNKLEN
jgi:hypothetical protein